MKTFFAIIGIVVVVAVIWYAYDAYVSPEVVTEIVEEQVDMMPE